MTASTLRSPDLFRVSCWFLRVSFVVWMVSVFPLISFLVYHMPCQFFCRSILMAFHLSWSDSKFSQVSRTLLSILASLNNAVVNMVSAYLISNSSSPLPSLWGLFQVCQLQSVSPLTFSSEVWVLVSYYYKFFSPASTGCFSLKFDLQQVT